MRTKTGWYNEITTGNNLPLTKGNVSDAILDERERDACANNHSSFVNYIDVFSNGNVAMIYNRVKKCYESNEI